MERRLTPNSSSSNLLAASNTNVSKSSDVMMIGHECYGSSSERNSYVLTSAASSSDHGPIILGVHDGHTSVERKRSCEGRNVRSIEQFFRSVFLPQGFPESVSEDYLQYQIWDTVQAFASSITHSLATQALLKGVGVGDTSATVLAATITWLMKDGVGMLGRILFAWMQSSYLDCDCKRWRLFADVINDCAIFLDIIASYFTNYFRVIVCLSGLCQSIVGVAGSATRAALTQHQARRNNMADVSAKDGSQETLVNLAALICSLLLMPLVSNDQSLVWMLFICFTALHLFANYCAVSAVCMETFNQARLHIVMKDLLNQEHVQSAGYHDGQHGVPTFMNVQLANKREPVLWSSLSCFLSLIILFL